MEFSEMLMIGLMGFVAFNMYRQTQPLTHPLRLQLTIKSQTDEDEFCMLNKDVQYWMVPRAGDIISLTDEEFGHKVYTVRLYEDQNVIVKLEDELLPDHSYLSYVAELKKQDWYVH